MKKRWLDRIVGAAATLVIAGIVMAGAVACDSLIGSDDSTAVGGGGADFDASLYYTKTEVDSLMVDAASDASDLYATINPAFSEQSITESGFANGTPTGWTVPANVHLGIFHVLIPDNGQLAADPGLVYIGKSTTSREYTSFTAEIIDQQVKIVVPVTPGDTVYAWADMPSAFSVDSYIRVFPVAWLK